MLSFMSLGGFMRARLYLSLLGALNFWGGRRMSYFL